MKLVILLISFLFLPGCGLVQTKQMQSWTRENYHKAEVGEIKWSEYYTGLFNQYNDHYNGGGKGKIMSLANSMIDASKKYESGDINKDQFEHLQRESRAAANSIGESVEAEAAERFRKSLMLYSVYKPVNCLTTVSGNQSFANCN